MLNKRNSHVSIIFYCFQFDCLNTLNDQLLENVRVEVEPPNGYQLVQEIPCPCLPYSETRAAYTVFQFPEELASTIGEWHF
jgi:coatomer protein complex subunit gamma